MFLLRPPGPAAVARFLASQRDLPLTYGDPGLSRTSPPDFFVDEERFVVGEGPEAFALASAALLAWRHYAFPWVRVHPVGEPIAPGGVVAVVVRHLGFCSMNACRIVEVTETPDRRGFAYGTLPDHAECGEETFAVAIDDSGAVTYAIRAVSRPRSLLARVGRPFARHLQARFRRESEAALRRAVEEGRSAAFRSAESRPRGIEAP